MSPARWLGNRSLSTQIMIIVSVLGVVVLGVGGLSISRLHDLNARAEQLYTEGLLPVHLIDQASIDMRTVHISTLTHGLSSTDESWTKYEKQIADGDTLVDADLAAYRDASTDPSGAAQLEAAWKRYQKARDEVFLPARRSGTSGKVLVNLPNDELAAYADESASKAAAISAKEAANANARMIAAEEAYAQARNITVGVLVGGMVLGFALALMVARGIVVRIRRVSEVIDHIADGDLTVTAGLTTRDDIGVMAGRLDIATERMREAVAAINANSVTLATSARDLATVGDSMAGSADQASTRADSVAAAAEQISANIETVAASSDEMSASIREIASSAADAAVIARGAVDVAESANTTVGKLGQSSAEIGNIVKVITAIAQQTNLLALNATIEAARAGEAGKGFAVVAAEVKDLAGETAKATEEISSRVQSIQSETDDAVGAIARIAEVIERINGYSDTIASAVEEQTATTTEIGRNVAEAAAGSAGIAEHITEVATAAQSTSSGVAESRHASQDLARMSAELQTLVGQFRI